VTNMGRRGGYEAPGEAPAKASGGAGVMQRMGSGALSPRAIMSSISAKGSELMQGRRGPGILSNDVSSPLFSLPASSSPPSTHPFQCQRLARVCVQGQGARARPQGAWGTWQQFEVSPSCAGAAL